MTVADRIREIRSTLPEGVELVAVSKFHPAETILEAYRAGQRSFGESRLQELEEKAPALPSDINWHFIGHLQTNKVRRLVGNVLLQVHVAAEETKFGFSPEELLDFFARGAFRSLKATHIRGLMAMATNTPDTARVRADFRRVADLRRQILRDSPDLRGFDTLSMGMSDDYPRAIAAGSTLVRVGTAIFGPREY